MFDEDLSQFLDPADFGVVITWDGNEYEGIFDNTTVVADINGAVQVDIQQPVILVRTEDFDSVIEGDRLHLKDDNIPVDADYLVAAVAPDGTGMTQIGLNEA